MEPPAVRPVPALDAGEGVLADQPALDGRGEKLPGPFQAPRARAPAEGRLPLALEPDTEVLGIAGRHFIQVDLVAEVGHQVRPGLCQVDACPVLQVRSPGKIRFNPGGQSRTGFALGRV
ncbi:MAG: hypothetical protein NTX87_00380 [Planctomycetota bacterium]|nr:hypothetical protein [Planctomycetota bacterium]